ncbi:uncharacterized protein LOC126903319 isoform X2 [Daktulosphaira vitifoliae]|uniref:uncharacterized protein LOC126903319 isoform X2 n=1 Tax=Daktulosphaira vitifoliae TaxID=58002 RepID=UPI0021A9BEC1|nr:uncharacterized protein LOC126903319 isoform X2 [Daktulosphaira vitifoliae]
MKMSPRINMKMSKVGNQTNSQDPQAVNSRVFVGNLNTFQCSKTDVEKMFQRYGRLVGISMHKGFAFVQFTNPFDARSACVGEDARTVLGQTLDVNLVAEPKPHQTGRKRQNLSKTGNDWEYYYNSYYASSTANNNNISGNGVKSSKRQKINHQYVICPSTKGRNTNSSCGNQQQNNTMHGPTIIPDQLKLYSNSDILICGNCREMFTELQGLLDHKKEYCKLRFTCKCNNFFKSNVNNNNYKWPGNLNEGFVSLVCVQCKESFDSAWDLMVHAQTTHMMNVYQLTTRDRITVSPNETESENGSMCSVGAQVNIDEDGNGSADELLNCRHEFKSTENNVLQDESSPTLDFDGTDKILQDSQNQSTHNSCQTCLVQQPLQTLMGVH